MLARLDELCRRLGSALQTRVIAAPAKSYEELGREAGEGNTELAWLPPVIGSRLVQAGRVLPIVLPLRRGKATFHTALFVRDDSNSLTWAKSRAPARRGWIRRVPRAMR